MREFFSKSVAALLACGMMVTFVVGCGEEESSSDPDQAIAVVGDREVTRGDVDLRRSIEAVGVKDSLPFYVVAAKLKRRFLDVLPETADGRAKMDRALELLRGETTPEIVAQSLMLRVRRDTLLKGGPATGAVKARYGDRVSTNPVVPLLDSLKPGQHLRQVLEDMVSYQIIEVAERSGDQVIVEIIEAPIYNYAMWFREQADGITVTMKDEELARTLREKLPNLWWAGMI